MMCPCNTDLLGSVSTTNVMLHERMRQNMREPERLRQTKELIELALMLLLGVRDTCLPACLVSSRLAWIVGMSEPALACSDSRGPRDDPRCTVSWVSLRVGYHLGIEWRSNQIHSNEGELLARPAIVVREYTWSRAGVS